MLNADDGTEIMIIPEHDKKQVRMLPLVREKTAELRLIMNDVPGSLAHVADSMALYGVNIIMSESRTLMKGKLAEWDVIIDTTTVNGTMGELMKELSSSVDIKKVEVLRD